MHSKMKMLRCVKVGGLKDELSTNCRFLRSFCVFIPLAFLFQELDGQVHLIPTVRSKSLFGPAIYPLEEWLVCCVFGLT